MAAMGQLGNILLAIFGISVLVIIHEGGHYLAARFFGMRVLKYSIGLGPVLYKVKPKGSETTFQLCAIPFLAYVQIAGMNPAEEHDKDDPALYPNQGLFARMVTIVAGPLANYLTASLLVLGLGLYGMESEVPVRPVTVGEVAAKSAAASAGLQPGDIIREAAGKRIRDMEGLIAVTKSRGGKATPYLIERNGHSKTYLITPKTQKDGRAVIGVMTKVKKVTRRLSLGKALQMSVVFPYEFSKVQVMGLWQKIREGSAEGVSGPWGMGKVVAASAERGLIHYLDILMKLSISLGMFNLFPIPALDGGRLVFLAFEVFTRKQANEALEATVHAIGMVLLLSILLLVTVRDVLG